jgi:hypothetical protein
MAARYPLVLNGSQIQELQTGDTINLTSPLSPTLGGTGVNNGTAYLTMAGNVTHVGAYPTTFTINGPTAVTLAGNLTTSGAYATTLTVTGTTNVTLPTSGTLATTAQATSTGKAIAMSLIFGF